jgi:hypothetical protein
VFFDIDEKQTGNPFGSKTSRDATTITAIEYDGDTSWGKVINENGWGAQQ